jgi:type II secretory pathway component GspD/PulD (secretin)
MRHLTTALTLAALTLSLAAPVLTAQAQSTPPPTEAPEADKPAPHLSAEPPAGTTDCGKLLIPRAAYSDCKAKYAQTRIVPLTNVTQQNEANEILVAVRNMFDPSLKFYLLSSNQNAIVLSSYPEELDKIEAFIHALDRPHKVYRLTYTIAESDAGKRLGVEHFSLIAADGQRTTLKQGDKVPVATGSYNTENSASQTQFTYLDVGMNFDATVTSISTGVSLKTKVEQSSVGPSNTIAGVQEPVVRQTVLEGVSAATLGKPLMLGAIDVPNSTRHIDIDVVVEQIK